MLGTNKSDWIIVNCECLRVRVGVRLYSGVGVIQKFGIARFHCSLSKSEWSCSIYIYTCNQLAAIHVFAKFIHF